MFTVFFQICSRFVQGMFRVAARFVEGLFTVRLGYVGFVLGFLGFV